MSTAKFVLLWVLAIVGFICAAPFFLWGIFSLSWAVASRFFDPFTEGHFYVSFGLGLLLAIGMTHGPAHLWLRHLEW